MRAGSGALGIRTDATAETNLFERRESGLRLLKVDLMLLASAASSSFSEVIKVASLSIRRRRREPATEAIMIWLSRSLSSSRSELGRVILYLAFRFSYSVTLSLGPMVDRVLDLRNR